MQRTKAAGAFLALAVWNPTPVVAISGAELLQLPSAFSQGYIAGVFDYRVNVAPEGIVSTDLVEIRTCVERNHITRLVLFEAVVAYLRSTPASLGQPALSAAFHVLNEICPLEN